MVHIAEAHPQFKWHKSTVEVRLISLTLDSLVTPGLSESFDVDGWVVKVNSQSRDILFKKTPTVKKCQAE